MTSHPFALFRVGLALAAAWVFQAAALAGPFPDHVKEYHLGAGGGFGQNYLPGNVLGAPAGGADTENPQESEMQLLSLGDGGWIVLEFTDSRIVDGPGPDLIVFENVFVPQSNPTIRFCETAIVGVSQDGDHYTTFTYNFIPRPDHRTGYPDQYQGFAGVGPTLSNLLNGVSPNDPAVAGGDAFDLAETGLAWARFVRIQDTGIPGTRTQVLDVQGDAVDDPGNASAFLDPATTKVGFDLDAIAAVHWTLYPAPLSASSSWLLVP